MRKSILAASVVLLAAFGVQPYAAAQSRDLTFEERVAAQEAIEREYYSHQIGATRSFEEAVPRLLIERKVRAYLEQSAALEELWGQPVTAAGLEQEWQRITRQSWFPERLEQIYAALGHDPVLIQECLVRPVLVERLSRAHEQVDAQVAPRFDEASFETVASPTASAVQDVAALSRRDGRAVAETLGSPTSCVPLDTWSTGALDDLPLGRKGHVAVWTGSVMFVVGGSGVLSGTNAAPITGDRYDPTTDSWIPTSAPGAIFTTSVAVWTGSEVIVWGQDGTSAFGKRYDPVANAWSPISSLGAPSRRTSMTVVWTGSEMIVWGGVSGGTTPLNDGARYSPSSDTWTAVSMTNAPTPRAGHTAVWTGSAMVVWGGGFGSTLTTTGGRYSPVTNTWLPTSTAAAPIARTGHVAVWTGSRVVIWGGGNSTTPQEWYDSGGRYDPFADTWAPTNLDGPPVPRKNAKAVWDGSEMIVWGGSAAANEGTGGRYDPASNTWTPMTTTGAPNPRAAHTMVWTGSRAIVWGGSSATAQDIGHNTGAQYDPATDSWTSTTTVGPIPRDEPEAIWTGSVAIIWGGHTDFGIPSVREGFRYDPALDAWTPMSTVNAPTSQNTYVVWTGAEMIVYSLNATNWRRYNPISDTWASMSSTNAPSARNGAGLVWSGNELIVWGGFSNSSFVNTGGRYNPVADTWTPTSTTNAPVGRQGPVAVWTGTEMVVWGGAVSPTTSTDTGGRYNPSTDTWVATTRNDAPSARWQHRAVWTGTEMVVWGGWNGSTFFNTGGRYDPATNSWTAVSTAGAPTARALHAAVWTGREMIVWGNGTGSIPTGGRYAPATDSWLPTSTIGAPVKRNQPGGVWTGKFMIVWGGENAIELGDGSRYSAADADADAISDSCDNCPSAANADQLDTDSDLVGNACDPDDDNDSWADAADNCSLSPNPSQADFDGDLEGDPCDLDDGLIHVAFKDRSLVEWQEEQGFGSWNVYKGDLDVLKATGVYTQEPGSNALAGRDCGTTDLWSADSTTPPAGGAAFFLAVGVSGGVEGSLGQDGAGSERPNDNPCP